MSAQQALLRAVHQHLTQDAALMAEVGSDGIRDRVLPRMQLPAIVYATIESRDYSTATEPGEEHLATIEVWAEGEGRARAQEIAARVKALLHAASLPLSDAHLVSILCTGMTSRRDKETRLSVVELRFRAVTE